MSDERSPLRYFLAGGVGGVCTVISGHPLDTVKVRLQTMPDAYKGTWDAARKIIVQEGPLSFYKGMTAPLVTVVPMFAISFFGFGLGQKIIADPGQLLLTDSQIFFAGMFSGATSSIVTIPAERIKCLLQAQTSGVKRYDGVFDCAVKLWKEGGIRNIYLGTCITLIRDIPASGIFFCVYERALRALMNQNTEVSWEPLVAGGCAGLANWVYAMPPDVVKSRLQTSKLGRWPNGARSVFSEILKREGPTALYRGIVPVMLRAFPSNAACFLGLEVAMQFFQAYTPWL